MAHAHRITSAFLEGATQAIAAGCQSVRQRVEKKGKDCTPHCTAFTVRYSTTVDQKRDRDKKGKGRTSLLVSLFLSFSLLSLIVSRASRNPSPLLWGLVDLREPCLPGSALIRFGRYQFSLGVINYHSAVGTWRLSQPRRTRKERVYFVLAIKYAYIFYYNITFGPYFRAPPAWEHGPPPIMLL